MRRIVHRFMFILGVSLFLNGAVFSSEADLGLDDATDDSVSQEDIAAAEKAATEALAAAKAAEADVDTADSADQEAAEATVETPATQSTTAEETSAAETTAESSAAEEAADETETEESAATSEKATTTAKEETATDESQSEEAAAESTEDEEQAVDEASTTTEQTESESEEGKKDEEKKEEIIIPKPPEEVEIIEVDKPVPSELKGIDTLEVDEPGGNWVEKRSWAEAAEKKMDKIRPEVDVIVASRMAFDEKRDNIDNEIDKFRSEVGIDRGQIEEVISYLTDWLKERRKKEVLDAEEQAFLKKLEEAKKTIEQLQKDVQGVYELETAVDTALKRLAEQIRLAREYKQEALEKRKSISKTLSHEKARQLFLEMDASWQSIQKIGEYIQGPFASYFDQLIENARTQSMRIKNAMDELEQKGLGFKEQLKKIKEGEEAQDKQEEEVKIRAEVEKELKEKEAQESRGWVARITSMFSSVGSTLWEWIRAPWDWLSSLWEKKNAELEIEEAAIASEEMAEPTSESVPAMGQEEASSMKPFEQAEPLEEISEQETITESKPMEQPETTEQEIKETLVMPEPEVTAHPVLEKSIEEVKEKDEMLSFPESEGEGTPEMEIKTEETDTDSEQPLIQKDATAESSF